jgi:hypothetical protein
MIKGSAEKSLFIVVKDNNTNKTKRIAIPVDTQIGTTGIPAELLLKGRLAVALETLELNRDNTAIVDVSSNVTITNVTVDSTSPSTATIRLPRASKIGELHIIKDVDGNAAVTTMTIQSSISGILIDGLTSTTFSTAYESIILYWGGSSWQKISSGGGGGGAPTTATYVTLSTDATLTNERVLTAGSGISITDNGAGSTVVISSQSGTDVSASYVTMGATGSLPNERVLTAGTGILLSDAGAGAAATLSINDNIVATVSGTRFTGPVVATGGLSGSLQQLSSGGSYLVAGGNITIASQSNGQVVISAVTASVSPVYEFYALAGKQTTNTAHASDKLSIGAFYYNPSVYSAITGSIKRIYWRAILDVMSTEPNMSASVDLYDVNGAVAYPPAIVANSAISSSNQTMAQVEVDLTTTFSNITGSGIFEARLWRTVSGSLTSSVTCRSARLVIESTSGQAAIFTSPFLAGAVTSNTSHVLNKTSLGAIYFSPQTVTAIGVPISYNWRAILDTTTTELNMSAAVDLYDVNGIFAYPPAIITNSTMSSSNPTMTQVSVNLTSVFNAVTGSGIIEARLWRTVSGSTASTVACRNARLDIVYSPYIT